MKTQAAILLILSFLVGRPAPAGVGDPQVGTDHPWYPGELAVSTFGRLAKTQADLFERVVGRRPGSDEDKALAAWLWRSTHYWHGEEGAQDLWDFGFTRGGERKSREYWGGLFASGFGLCGTTHAQWAAEFEALLGHGRGRVVGVEGHNSFEVFLTGGPYGDGKWVLLDHDVSTVVFGPEGKALLSIPEVAADLDRLIDPAYRSDRQRGWPVSGLHPADGQAYRRYRTVEYLPGYAGPPPIVHLRRGESLRRYQRPGLDDGETFVFWGRNDHRRGMPGPERSRTWVDQPDRMYGSPAGVGGQLGQARFANAVFTYRPDFASGDYREGVVEEGPDRLVFEFRSPYLIAATPAAEGPWGIYEPGCRNGLLLHGSADCPVAVSTDGGATWQESGRFADGLDLTDRVKGHDQYLIRFGAGASALRDSGLTLVTTCQANGSILPRLKDGGTAIRFEAGDLAIVSAGPNRDQALAHRIDGGFGTPAVTLEIATPRGEPALAIYAAAHVNSGNPPDPAVRYQIEVSTDAGATWNPIVADWTIPRRGQEPADFWSQSFCWGTLDLDGAPATSARVRFRNDGRKPFARCEAHLAYRVARTDPTEVTFAWSDDEGAHRASHTFEADDAEPWEVPTGSVVRMNWVEIKPVIR